MRFLFLRSIVVFTSAVYTILCYLPHESLPRFKLRPFKTNHILIQQFTPLTVHSSEDQVVETFKKQAKNAKNFKEAKAPVKFQPSVENQLVVDLKGEIEGLKKKIDHLDSSIAVIQYYIDSKYNKNPQPIEISEEDQDSYSSLGKTELLSERKELFAERKVMQAAWNTLKDDLKHITVSNQIDFTNAQFVESEPHSLNGNRLYQREEESLNMANMLLSQTGISKTPLLDQSFGVGKTSFIYKFRKVIAELPKESQPHSMHRLNDAVYLQCLFDESFLSAISKELKKQKHALDDIDYDKHIIEVIIAALRVSCHRNVVLESLSIEGLMQALSVTTTKFIFHFDEVGLFEILDKEVAARILYRLLNIGYALKSKQNHFYILTGRSALLHMIGINNNILKKSSSKFQSPCSCEIIQLSCLTQHSIKQIFIDEGFGEYISKNNNLKDVHLITGGVPRAVTCWILALRASKSVVPFAKDDTTAMNVLVNYCAINVDESDKKLYQTLLDLSWAQVDFDISTTSIQGLPVTSMLAKYGLYAAVTNSTVSPSRYHIVVPLYTLKALDWYPNSIVSIIKHEDVGSRFEIGFRKILISKLLLGEATRWTDIGLDYLDSCGIPFTSVTASYPFPKMSTLEKSAVLADVEKCMKEIHQGIHSDHYTFSPKFLNDICSLLQPNRFYQALPKSGSADSFIRLSETSILKFQFKNYIKPFTESSLKQEVKKCIMEKWSVFLVIVCSSGHSINGGGDQVIHFDSGLVAILLSKDSVERYFGKHRLSEISSKPILNEAFNQLVW